MIDSINLCGVATFGADTQYLTDLRKFNYIYGSNAAGKTTISKVIANEALFPTCRISWKDGVKLQARVYNRDFVDTNFSQVAALKGIFTLGEEQIGIAQKIAEAKAACDELTEKQRQLTKTLQGDDGNGGKVGELAFLEASFKDKCWAQKKKHDGDFLGAFAGVRGASDKFTKRVLAEMASNKAKLDSLASLQKRARTIFGPTQSSIAPILSVSFGSLIELEANPILKKRVIGKHDVDIAEMIEKLGNSDWVKEGQRYYESNGLKCPFCQQPTTDKLGQSLAQYFDKTFDDDSNAINALESAYNAAGLSVQQELQTIIESNSKFADLESLKKSKLLIDAAIAANIQCIRRKKKEPSQALALKGLTDTCEVFRDLIASANNQIAEHNATVQNLEKEKETLTAQVWKYLLETELKTDIADYERNKGDVEKAIASLKSQIEDAKTQLRTKKEALRSLEKSTTSIQPTIDAINGLLKSFGFQGFSLAKVAEQNSYSLLRPDGKPAKETLSEGERTFVTVLYFYHLLKGSESETGVSTNRVVVFDDPVSSLDSDILFIVASLIKGLFDDVRSGAGHIKQVFVLTHNVYFHKEITFNSRRRKDALAEESFWIVRKVDLQSKLEKYEWNPIKTSYEMLWSEVRRRDRSSLQNTLRRILENYFRIMGNIDIEKIHAKFDGKERIVCRSLLSWIHDGSHYAHDDVFVSIDESTVAMYLSVFEGIFDKSGHLAHYAMMMDVSSA